MISDRSNNLTLKYQKFIHDSWIGINDIGIRKFEFVAKTQFLSGEIHKKSLASIKPPHSVYSFLLPKNEINRWTFTYLTVNRDTRTTVIISKL